MGRPFFCECGEIQLWVGDIWSSQNSQQLADPYTFTHIMHGALIYFFLQVAFGKRLSLWQRLLVAVLISCVWEVAENSNFIIDRYRANTISLGYYGDSVFNSIADTLAFIFGFWLAYKLPWKITLALGIVTEVLLLVCVRDSLLLNVIMLIHPINAIKVWQMAGH